MKVEYSQELFNENFIILELDDSEKIFRESGIVLDEAYTLVNENSLKRTYANLKKETEKLLAKLEAKFKDKGNDQKFLRKVYNLRKKLMKRQDDMNKLMNAGDYAGAIKYIVYTGDIKMLGTILEISNFDGWWRNFVSIMASAVTSGASMVGTEIYNFVVSKKLATSKTGIILVKDYMNFLKSTIAKLDHFIDKYSK